MIAILLSFGLQILGPIVLVRLAWWAFGDFLLDHVGIPFLDASWTPESAYATRPTTEHGEWGIRPRSSATMSRRSSHGSV